MGQLQPGKGLHVEVDKEIAKFTMVATGKVYAIMTEYEGEEVIKHLIGMEGWEDSSDSFGKKAHMAYPIDEGTELRVTAVWRRKRLNLDIRTWFTP